MKVLLVAKPNSQVPPETYSGVERIIDEIAHQLVLNGHDVIVLANKGPEKVIYKVINFPFVGNKFFQRIVNIFFIYLQVFLFAPRVVHGWGSLFWLSGLLFVPIRFVHSYQLPFNVLKFKKLPRFLNRPFVVGCSKSLIKNFEYYDRSLFIHNCVPLRKYDLVSEVQEDAPFIFLGRIHKEKGCHEAIRIARQCKKRLLIAGIKGSEGPEWEYFNNEIAPQIDGVNVIYLGPVNDNQKNKILGTCAALLFPIFWEEPFGIVMIEAMACGTPVIANNRGAVPEIIVNSVNGFCVENEEQFLEKAKLWKTISRYKCRESVEQLFTGEKIFAKYLDVYNKSI